MTQLHKLDDMSDINKAMLSEAFITILHYNFDLEELNQTFNAFMSECNLKRNKNTNILETKQAFFLKLQNL